MAIGETSESVCAFCHIGSLWLWAAGSSRSILGWHGLAVHLTWTHDHRQHSLQLTSDWIKILFFSINVPVSVPYPVFQCYCFLLVYVFMILLASCVLIFSLNVLTISFYCPSRFYVLIEYLIICFRHLFFCQLTYVLGHYIKFSFL